MKKIWLCFLLLFLAACTSAPTKKNTIEPEESVPAPKVPMKASRPGFEKPISVDYDGLQRHLGLERELERTGFAEKSFSTCEVGYGYSSSKDCRKEFFVVINFRLMCRDSVGTVSTVLTEDDLMPLRRRSVTWLLQGAGTGEIQLDNEGYGQIKTTMATSGKKQRLKLTVDNDFLFLKAGEVKRIVAPGNWCN